MTDLTTLSAEELDAQIEALSAEKARREAEPDWEAWRPALLHFIAATHYPPVSPGLDTCDKMHIRALQAAAPHFPTPEIDESQIDQIAHRCQFADGIDSRTLTPYNAAQRAIRETIRLLGHAPKRERPLPVRGKDYVKPDWMGDYCTTETTCAAHGRCMPIIGQNCGAPKGGAA